MSNSTVNRLELARIGNDAWALRIDGELWPGTVDRRALASTVGCSRCIRVWAERPPVVVDQVGNEVRWQVWANGQRYEFWFLREAYECHLRHGLP